MKKKRLKFFFAVFLLSGLIILDGFGFLYLPKSLLFSATQPAVGFVSNLAGKIKGAFGVFFYLGSLVSDRAELLREKKRLSSENAALKLFQQENEELRVMLGIRKTLPYTTVGAQVVTKDPLGVKDQVTINRGRSDGLSPGNAVIDQYGNLLGAIREVYEETAVFFLVTDGSVKIDGSVVGKKGLGLITGSHSLGLTFELLTQNFSAQTGNQIITAGLTGAMPAGILVGFLNQQLSGESELFQKFSVTPASDLKNFRFVMVITQF
ncbi:MAG: rod shape-determining protein MreC [Candidatus Doudnabacteria bacterium]|nr:rod shape-determining protein MreC [Candidatus Doudnabacteria bacterium]